MYKVGLYIWPEKTASNSKQFDDLKNSFAELDPDFDSKYIVPRGGFDIPPPLTATLFITGSMIGQWLLAGVGSDFYKALKSCIKKMLKIKPPGDSRWPADMDVRYCQLIIHFQYARHSFILDFNITGEVPMTKALENLPELIKKLSAKPQPNHHLLLWDGSTWKVTLEQEAVI